MNNKESTLILDKNEGYFIVQLKKDELNIIRNIVENHWLMQLNEHHTELGNLFKNNMKSWYFFNTKYFFQYNRINS